uniref:Ceramide synthase 5 n=1 Tax=Haemonchus contortus TaxID=6289 RepID=A0A7I4YW64_HAECO
AFLFNSVMLSMIWRQLWLKLLRGRLSVEDGFCSEEV